MHSSMTGFGRAANIFETKEITVEIKSVNHRYFDFSARVPRLYGFLEEKLKSFIQESVTRGKIEVYVSIGNTQGQELQITVNDKAVRSYIEGLREVSSKFGLKDDLTLSTLSTFNDIFSVKSVEEDAELLWQEVKQTAQRALESFSHMRASEGEKLCDDMISRVDYIERSIKVIDELSDKSVQTYKEKLEEKIREVLADRNFEESRVLTEVAIFADKVAVAEETVRLKSHLQQFRQLITSEQPIGRKLDFLIQEINREVNTIGSKANNIEIAKIVVDLKSEIEKIREQAQNVE